MPRSIACGHCGLSHGSVAEVRNCALATDHAAIDPQQVGQAPPETGGAAAVGSRRRSPSPTDSISAPRAGSARPLSKPSRGPLGRTTEQLAGPAGLGRSVVLPPGAPIPTPWAGCHELRADIDADTDTIEELHRAWRTRQRLVIRWDGELPEADSRLDIAFEQLSPATEIPGERLRFAVTANAVNLLGAEPDFAPIRLAIEAGAVASGSADVMMGDITEVWADGGPLDPLTSIDLGGFGLVPRAHLQAGVLHPQHRDRPEPSAELAPDQLQAVGHRGGPSRIIAPAGSGKTRVLTERTRHLVLDRGLDPSTVSLVAYNRRARLEMADRLSDVSGLDIRTLNSLALAIATGTGAFARPDAPTAQSRGLRTISEMDMRRLLDRIVPGRRRRQLTDPLEPWIDALSACRLGLRDPAEIETTYGADIAGFPDVLVAYRQELKRRGELDFDEQILLAIETLLTNPLARTVARRAAPLLLVDEFQDLTPAHLLLVRLLAGPAADVFAVGDDDQTIYGYSGASPDWLVNFSRYFPGAEDHPLTVNYRCPPVVVSAAQSLLSHNQHRVPKTIVSGAPATSTETTSSLAGLIVNSGTDPQQRLVEHVTALIDAGARPGEIAVLARVNAALMPPTVYLAAAGHSVARPAGVDVSLLDRSGVSAALSWLRLASAPEQRLGSDDLRMALRRPPRSLHPRVTDWLCEQRSVKDLLALSQRLTKEKEAQTVSEFTADLAQLRAEAGRGASTGELLDLVYHDIGLLGAASQLDQSQRTARRAAHGDDLSALRAVAEIGPEPSDFEPWLRNHLESVPRFDAPERPEAVSLATIHTTKGLEWPHVIVHDVRGDLHPHRLATDVEEERRIFHVAITRCSTSLLVNAVPRSSGPASPFVAELAKARPNNEPWPKVTEAAQPSIIRSSGGAQRKTKPKRADPATPEEAARREALAAWRAGRCKADGVPAYIIIDNATLDAIAAAMPRDLAGLGRVKGIGPAKLERYGADVLGVLSDIS